MTRPISAPRDGTRIIGWYGDRPIIVWWREGPDYDLEAMWVPERGKYIRPRRHYWTSGYYRHPEPDAWLPVPERP